MPISGYFDRPFCNTGTKTTVPDGTQSDGSVSYEVGYGIDYTLDPLTNPSALDIEQGKMNQLFYDITSALQNWQQNAFPPFITSTMNGGTAYSYSKGNAVRYGGVTYVSLINANTDTPPTSNWAVLNTANGITGTQSVTGATHAVVASDSGLMTLRSNSGAVMVDTLPGTGSGVLAAGFVAEFVNSDASALYQLTVASGANLNGAASGSIILGPGQRVEILSDGTNYYSIGGVGRTKLGANTNLYVNGSTGSNSNNGIASGTAWLTIQHAWDWMFANLDLNNFTVTVQIADATYTGGLTASGNLLPGQAGYSNIVFNGNSGTPANVVLNNASALGVSVTGALITVQNMKISGAGSCLDCIQASQNGILAFNNLIFGACSVSQIVATNAGQVIQLGNYTISGGAGSHMLAQQNGFISLVSSTITLTGTPAYSNAFAVSSQLGNIYAPSITYSGGATGTRYSININGIIQTNGAGASYFPGSIVGSTATGGQYV